MRREGSTPVSEMRCDDHTIVHTFVARNITYFPLQSDLDCFLLACCHGKFKMLQELVNRHNMDPHVVNEVCVPVCVCICVCMHVLIVS